MGHRNPAIPPLFDQPLDLVTDFDTHAECGRGLLLVRQLADNGGGCTLGEGLVGVQGKLLWFEIFGATASVSLPDWARLP